MHEINAHTQEKKFKCGSEECNFRTNCQRYFKLQLLRHEKDPRNQCPLTCSFPGCHFRYRLQVQMKSHLRNHLKSKSMFKCKLCANTYPDKGSIHYHECMIHNKTPYKCSECAYTAFHKKTLGNHFRRHHRFNGIVNTSRGILNIRSQRHSLDLQCEHCTYVGPDRPGAGQEIDHGGAGP